jgi:hypothetical protein
MDDDVRVITLDMLLVLWVLEDSGNGQQIAALGATREDTLIGWDADKCCLNTRA